MYINEILRKESKSVSTNKYIELMSFYRNVSFSRPSFKNNMHSPHGITKNQAGFGRLIEIMIFLHKFGANFGIDYYHQLACCVEEDC